MSFKRKLIDVFKLSRERYYKGVVRRPRIYFLKEKSLESYNLCKKDNRNGIYRKIKFVNKPLEKIIRI